MLSRKPVYPSRKPNSRAPSNCATPAFTGAEPRNSGETRFSASMSKIQPFAASPAATLFCLPKRTRYCRGKRTCQKGAAGNRQRPSITALRESPGSRSPCSRCSRPGSRERISRRTTSSAGMPYSLAFSRMPLPGWQAITTRCPSSSILRHPRIMRCSWPPQPLDHLVCNILKLNLHLILLNLCLQRWTSVSGLPRKAAARL